MIYKQISNQCHGFSSYNNANILLKQSAVKTYIDRTVKCFASWDFDTFIYFPIGILAVSQVGVLSAGVLKG